MHRARQLLAAIVLMAFLAAIVWQMFSLYTGGPTLRHPPATGAKADSSFFAQH